MAPPQDDPPCSSPPHHHHSATTDLHIFIYTRRNGFAWYLHWIINIMWSPPHIGRHLPTQLRYRVVFSQPLSEWLGSKRLPNAISYIWVWLSVCRYTLYLSSGITYKTVNGEHNRNKHHQLDNDRVTPVLLFVRPGWQCRSTCVRSLSVVTCGRKTQRSGFSYDKASFQVYRAATTHRGQVSLCPSCDPWILPSKLFRTEVTYQM